jgi:hypothetical protein
VSVLDIQLAAGRGQLKFQTSARSRVSAGQSALAYPDGRSAIASADPKPREMSRSWALKRRGHESAEAFSCDVYRGWHARFIPESAVSVKRRTVSR